MSLEALAEAIDAELNEYHVLAAIDTVDRELRDAVGARAEVVVWLRYAALIDRGAGALVLAGAPDPPTLERLSTSDRSNLAIALRAAADAADPR